MAIVRAGKDDLDPCVDLLFIPEIGKLYFPKKELLRTEVEKGIEAGEIFIEISRGGVTPVTEIRGVIWYQREGFVHSFPYLHMITVRDECRHQGIGAKLMDFYEQDSLSGSKSRMRTKVFLLVSACNSSARQFYRNRGYTEVCRLENLFRKDIAEILLMKTVRALK